MFSIQDQTGTQTNCPRPLSRKKLRQLRWHHPATTSGSFLYKLFSRKQGKAHRSGARKTHIEAQGQLADGTKYQLIRQVPVTLFDRMKATFKAALLKVRRSQQRGGQA